MLRLLSFLVVGGLLSISSAFAQSNCLFDVGANDGCAYVYIFQPNGVVWPGYEVGTCPGANNRYCSNPSLTFADSSGKVYLQSGIQQAYTIFPKNSACFVNWQPVYNKFDVVDFKWNGSTGWGYIAQTTGFTRGSYAECYGF